MNASFDNKELKNNILFQDMDDAEIAACLSALSANVRNYEKGNLIFHAGDVTERMGIVLRGSVTIEMSDMWGNCTILSSVGKNGFFGETYALLKDAPLLVDVEANADTTVLFLNIGRVRKAILTGSMSQSRPSKPAPAGTAFRNGPSKTSPAGSAFRNGSSNTAPAETASSNGQPKTLPSGTASSNGTSWISKLTARLLMISLRKNLVLSERSFHTAPKTIRGKVLSYLTTVSLQKHSSEFDIPFDRQQLADYLNTDRTALSKELGKMRAEGIIKCRRNHFVLLEK